MTEYSSTEEAVALHHAEHRVITQALSQFPGDFTTQQAAFFSTLEYLSSTEIATSTMLAFGIGQPALDDERVLTHLRHQGITQITKPRAIADLRRVAIQTILQVFDNIQADPSLQHKYFVPGFKTPTQEHSHTILDRVTANIAFAENCSFVQQTATTSDLTDRLEILLEPDELEYFCRVYQISHHQNNHYQLPFIERQGLAQPPHLTKLNSSAKLDILEKGRAITELSAGIEPGSTVWILADGSKKSGYTRSGKPYLNRHRDTIPTAIHVLHQLDSSASSHLTPSQRELLKTVNEIMSIGGSQADGLRTYHEQHPGVKPNPRAYKDLYKDTLARLNKPPRHRNTPTYRQEQAQEIYSLLYSKSVDQLSPIKRQLLQQAYTTLSNGQSLTEAVKVYNESHGTRYTLSAFYAALYQARNIASGRIVKKPITKTTPQSPPKVSTSTEKTNKDTDTDKEKLIKGILARAKARRQGN